MGILQIFTLLGALGMFLYGMNLMSSGLQKAAGERYRRPRWLINIERKHF